jgi:hypothetical protein
MNNNDCLFDHAFLLEKENIGHHNEKCLSNSRNVLTLEVHAPIENDLKEILFPNMFDNKCRLTSETANCNFGYNQNSRRFLLKNKMFKTNLVQDDEHVAVLVDNVYSYVEVDTKRHKVGC